MTEHYTAIPGPGPDEFWGPDDLAAAFGPSTDDPAFSSMIKRLGYPARLWHGRIPLWSPRRVAEVWSTPVEPPVEQARYERHMAERRAAWALRVEAEPGS